VGIGEIIIVLIVALIVVPPEKLPEVVRAAGKILRELRLASNTVLRELSDAVEEPPRFQQPPAIARPPETASPPPLSAPPDDPS
jgi:Sec-independent protein translocase protein TatA